MEDAERREDRQGCRHRTKHRQEQLEQLVQQHGQRKVLARAPQITRVAGAKRTALVKQASGEWQEQHERQ